jgi:hypothetical protein
LYGIEVTDFIDVTGFRDQVLGHGAIWTQTWCGRKLESASIDLAFVVAAIDAGAAATAGPHNADEHSVTLVVSFDCGARLFDPSGTFVANRVAKERPFVAHVQNVQVGVAEASSGDLDQNFVRTDFWHLNVFQFHCSRAARRAEGIAQPVR